MLERGHCAITAYLIAHWVVLHCDRTRSCCGQNATFWALHDSAFRPGGRGAFKQESDMRVTTEPSKHDPANDRDDNRDPSKKHRGALVKTRDKGQTRYKPSAGELAAINAHVARLAANRPVTPRLKIDQGTISTHNPDPFIANILLAEALGTADSRISNGLIEQLARAAAKPGEVDERRLNFLLAVITANKPSNELVALLKAQMAAVHTAAMDCAGRLGQAAFGPEFDSIQNAFNKFTRTFAVQLETLKRYESRADERVVLQQSVSVTEGGQAIVGNVHQTSNETAMNGRPISKPPQTDAPAIKVPINGGQGRRPRRTNEEQSSA
jgi:hypothetical protein